MFVLCQWRKHHCLPSRCPAPIKGSLKKCYICETPQGEDCSKVKDRGLQDAACITQSYFSDDEQVAGCTRRSIFRSNAGPSCEPLFTLSPRISKYVLRRPVCRTPSITAASSASVWTQGRASLIVSSSLNSSPPPRTPNICPTRKQPGGNSA